jgi:N-acetyl-gamma-glutamyl-phosphate reductase
MTARVFIDGGAGTTGLQIHERLAGRAAFSLVTIDAARRKDPAARAEALNSADVAILCLPDEAAREAAALVTNPATRIIDASTAHRVVDGWTYGFPELVGREAVARARRVSNPGCYPTGFLALVAPLVRAGLIPADTPLSCNAVSGYSGGGNAMIADYEGGGTPSAWSGYALTLAHKHLPEMQRHAGLTTAPIFAPAVVPVYSGMIVEVPVHLAALPGRPGPARLREALADFYAGSALVEVVAAHDGATLPVELAANTDRLRLFVLGNADGGQARLVAALDNLGKGAAGAAVQTLNLLTGRPETEGLRL